MGLFISLQPQRDGDIAQSVEQRTENPCVAGSIPAVTTRKQKILYRKVKGFFVGGVIYNQSEKCLPVV
jgi:hypothetical protein